MLVFIFSNVAGGKKKGVSRFTFNSHSYKMAKMIDKMYTILKFEQKQQMRISVKFGQYFVIFNNFIHSFI